ncbi:hypothetical protein [Marinobacterium stanieri]|uniref:Uncharacterized protein n=1 Tax=Marinobacterium stanieri TaxID=49186 RepID=A0A1N6QAW6_9GAMM|nr:hypothetical protein [Marinobacterium stanieri]SIQ13701.1 hypothetical protein SAMN05421647_102384 [Marinobacterium stanieri]
MAKKSVIANLVVTLGANSARLKTEMDKAKDDARKWAKSMKSIASTAGKGFGIALAGASIAGAGFIAMIERQADQLDQLAKKADKLGLGTAALQKLEYQAELTGVAQNKLGTALQRMTRRVAEAADGTGAAKDALAELGLDADELAKKTPDQQFYAIADAMKGISSQGDRVKLAMRIFDTEGVGLVNTFAADLNSLGKEFDNLGVAITRPQAAAVEAYNDAKTRLGTIFTGLQQHVTAGVVPAMEVLISKTVEFIDEMGGIDQVAESVTVGALTMIQSMVEGFKTLIEIITDVKELYYTVVSGGQKFGGIVSKGVASLAGTVGLDTLEREANLLGDSFYKVSEDTKQASEQMLKDAEMHSERMGSLIDNVNQAKAKVIEGFEERGSDKDGSAGAESEQITQWRKEIAALQQQMMESPGKNVAPILAEISTLKEKIANSENPVVGANDKNTTATQENTRALTAAAAALSGQKGGNTAWQKIFGSPDEGKKQGDKLDKNFIRAAQSYRNAMAKGSTGAAEKAANRMQEVLESFQRNPFGHSSLNGRGISTGRADEYDVTGMQAVMKKLLDGEGKSKDLGTLTLNMQSDKGTNSATVNGDSAELQNVLSFFQRAAAATPGA